MNLKIVLGFGSIFYVISVVGGVVNCTGVIYGVRTSLFLTSQRMPSRYGGVHEYLQLYKRNNYIYVNVIIYVYIRTHRCLYVVITTKVKYGGTMRLRMYAIGKRLGVGNICRWYFWFEILYTQRCWWGSKLHGIDIWRRDTQCPALRCASECKQL